MGRGTALRNMCTTKLQSPSLQTSAFRLTGFWSLSFSLSHSFHFLLQTPAKFLSYLPKQSWFLKTPYPSYWHSSAAQSSCLSLQAQYNLLALFSSISFYTVAEISSLSCLLFFFFALFQIPIELSQSSFLFSNYFVKKRPRHCNGALCNMSQFPWYHKTTSLNGLGVSLS